MFRIVTFSNGEYSIRMPMMEDTVAEARERAQKEQPHVRIVTDAEEIADRLEETWVERKHLETALLLANTRIAELEMQLADTIEKLKITLSLKGA